MYEHILERDGRQMRLNFETDEGVFSPTGTSALLIEGARLAVDAPAKILDLGCGCGVTGIALGACGLCSTPLYASDISEKAVQTARKNAARNKIQIEARQGSLFEPWQGWSFDVIVDDVAGISDEIAKLSSWYSNGVPCGAGRDGTRWVVKVIEQAKRYLNKGGRLIFPLLTLSNEGRIRQALKENFSSCDILSEKEWFLPDNIASESGLITDLVNDGSIAVKKKFGKWIWSTKICSAYY